MGSASRRVLLLFGLAAVALGGCGGGDSTTATTGSRPQSTAVENPFHPGPHHDSGGGSEQFRVKGGDNSIQEFGEEADESEFQEAATALHGFLDARAEGDRETSCSYLAADVTKSLQQLSASSKQSEGADCAQLLRQLSKGVPAATLVEAAQADVGSLRVEGERAFLIYRGAGGTVYAMQMQKDGGEWKVGGLSGTPLG